MRRGQGRRLPLRQLAAARAARAARKRRDGRAARSDRPAPRCAAFRWLPVHGRRHPPGRGGQRGAASGPDRGERTERVEGRRSWARYGQSSRPPLSRGRCPLFAAGVVRNPSGRRGGHSPSAPTRREGGLRADDPALDAQQPGVRRSPPAYLQRPFGDPFHRASPPPARCASKPGSSGLRATTRLSECCRDGSAYRRGRMGRRRSSA